MTIIYDLPEQYYTKIQQVIDKALQISNFKKTVMVKYVEKIEEDTFAITSWPIRYFWQTPIIRLSKSIFEQDIEMIGVTLTHELIHCRQGIFKIFWQNFTYAILRKKEFPPVEMEAYDSINSWYT